MGYYLMGNWQKDSYIGTDSAADTGIAGDNAVGKVYSSRYWKDNEDGTFEVVDEYYFVEPLDDYEGAKIWGVTGMYWTTTCTDLDDVGGTEIMADVEYDTDVDVFFHYTLEDAEKKAKELAEMNFLWSYNFSWGLSNESPS
jgi:hypothetical protein